MATQVEQIVSAARSRKGDSYIDEHGMTYCQRFVKECYADAGITTSKSIGSATAAYNAFCRSKAQHSKASQDDIPVGAAVYYSSNDPVNGHVGIYVGDNKLIHVWTNGKVCETSVDAPSGYRGWGWQAVDKNSSNVPTGAGTIPATEEYSETLISDNNGWKVTAYCPCKICCGQYSPEVTGQPSKTSSGTTPKAKHTIAVDTSVIPYGTKIRLEPANFGNKNDAKWQTIYTAEDTGGAIKGNRIDVYFDSHSEAINSGFGDPNRFLVYKVEGDTSSGSKSGKKYNEIEIRYLTGELSLRPNAKSIRLNIGDTVKLNNLGKYLSGSYWISGISRTIDNNGYTQSLQVCKAGFGNSLKEQQTNVQSDNLIER